MTFLLNNFAAITASLTALVACFSFVFSLIKWLDSRNREINNQRYLQYRELIRVLSPVGEEKVSLQEQILCIILLKEFKEYYKTTKEVFFNPQIINRANNEWKKNILPEVEKVLRQIEEEQN